MNQCYLINHADVAQSVYYFLSREEEQLFLKALNDELAVRVGERFSSVLSPNELIFVSSLTLSEIRNYFKDKIENYPSVVIKLRKELLKETRRNRRAILTSQETTIRNSKNKRCEKRKTKGKK